MDLSVADEIVILENLPVFHANGFAFETDEAAPPGSKIRLAQVPYSKNTVLTSSGENISKKYDVFYVGGKLSAFFSWEDVMELVCLLRDSPGEMFVCSKIRAMFASRACRSAIMIGDSLSSEEMMRVVRHLSFFPIPFAFLLGAFGF